MGASGPEAGIGDPLGHQLFVAHEAVATALIGLGPVLLTQGIELLPQGEEDRMVVVQSPGTRYPKTLSESEESCQGEVRSVTSQSPQPGPERGNVAS